MQSEVGKIKHDPKPGKIRQALITACGDGYNELDRNFPFEFIQSTYTIDICNKTYTLVKTPDFDKKLANSLGHKFS